MATRSTGDNGQPVASVQPFFSVVIAAYNPGERILPTIKSVRNQTYPNYEILVIGDGCTDATGEILAAHFGEGIRWDNLGCNHGSQSFPNNRGISLARGTHIAYLGHDDIWSPHHLQSLADVISSADPDFAVSGAIFHAPEGSDLWFITGLFDDSSAAASEFFPPSSFAHRRSIHEKIGFWNDPMLLNCPVDCDFLLRASAAGCSFTSTGRITVHKFAAGHRYLFYRFPSSTEQEAMLANLADPLFETRLLAAILARASAGARLGRKYYPDYSGNEPGALYRAGRSTRGLALEAPVPVETSVRLPLDGGPGALDWLELQTDPKYGQIRWSGANPNPTYLVNVRITEPFGLRIHVAAFASPTVAQALRLRINDRDVAFTVETTEGGTFVLNVMPDLPLPIENGLRIVFETHRPGNPLPSRAIKGKRFALSGFEVLID